MVCHADPAIFNRFLCVSSTVGGVRFLTEEFSNCVSVMAGTRATALDEEDEEDEEDDEEEDDDDADDKETVGHNEVKGLKFFSSIFNMQRFLNFSPV